MSTTEEGCYLVYESHSSGRLLANYSKEKVPGAIGFWKAGEGKKIQGFKFKKPTELVKGCTAGTSGRKLFYTGWAQFIKTARNYNGKVMILPKEEGVQALDTQVYGYDTHGDIFEFAVGEEVDINTVRGIACLPHGENPYEGIMNMSEANFLTIGTQGVGYSSNV
mmetsp:Transcript_29313/g.45567  ORF Transcript_29313/g.45567 Transcript_29313/m.45567 type:complete len:165 (-) Transcript_29313:1445-1939(-)